MEKIKLTIDGQIVEVAPGTSVLNAAKQIKHKIPHYCYHEGLSVAGNCRMCLVKIDKMPKPAISCKTPVAQDMVVYTQTEEVKKMQQSIMEFLLINHPIDCPTCDQAGECKLQDYYMKFDLAPSRFAEEKVHKDKRVDLGAGIRLDEERCIVCTRCVRFCQEVAQSEELMVQNRGDHSMVATFPGEKMKNPYAGNTVDICPVGALTSDDFRFKKRVWFLKKTNSVCTGCSKGCNITIEESEGVVYRYKPRYNANVNQWWMCDEGRMSYKALNENRLLKPAFQNAKEWVSAPLEGILDSLAEHLNNAAQPLIFVASAQETNEEILAFLALAKALKAEVAYSKNDPLNPFSDNILIEADKNPNLAQILALNLKPLHEVLVPKAKLVVQNSLSLSDLENVKKCAAQILCVFTPHTQAAYEEAAFVLPTPTFAEQDGHFINSQGLTQKISKAIQPKGEAQLVSYYAPLWLNRLSSSIKNAG